GAGRQVVAEAAAHRRRWRGSGRSHWPGLAQNHTDQSRKGQVHRDWGWLLQLLPRRTDRRWRARASGPAEQAGSGRATPRCG
ncbi:hypothetical protein DQE80_16075, partial [Enterococcus sp. HPCN18]